MHAQKQSESFGYFCIWCNYETDAIVGISEKGSGEIVRIIIWRYQKWQVFLFSISIKNMKVAL